MRKSDVRGIEIYRIDVNISVLHYACYDIPPSLLTLEDCVGGQRGRDGLPPERGGESANSTKSIYLIVITKVKPVLKDLLYVS